MVHPLTDVVTLETLAASLQAFTASFNEFRTQNQEQMQQIVTRLDGLDAKMDKTTWRLQALEARTMNSVLSYSVAGYTLQEVPSPTTGAKLPQGATATLNTDTRVLSLDQASVNRWLAFYGITSAPTLPSLNAEPHFCAGFA